MLITDLLNLIVHATTGNKQGKSDITPNTHHIQQAGESLQFIETHTLGKHGYLDSSSSSLGQTHLHNITYQHPYFEDSA